MHQCLPPHSPISSALERDFIQYIGAPILHLFEWAAGEEEEEEEKRGERKKDYSRIGG